MCIWRRGAGGASSGGGSSGKGGEGERELIPVIWAHEGLSALKNKAKAPMQIRVLGI
jgi:hypothetical protein